jgi:SAM-dependent methyltransferase
MFMLYHLPESKQSQAFAEFKRVLKPDGRFVLATSGTDNKVRHRMLEQQIANNFDQKTTAPKLMNAGFNTERAEAELPKYFSHVYAYKQDSKMVIDDDDRVDAYLDSLRSLRDQFDPVPDEFTFEDALVDVVLPQIEHDMGKYGRFIDLIRRSIFICSDSQVLLHEPSDFVPVTAQKHPL